MMVRYAQVERGEPFPDSAEAPPHLDTYIADTKHKIPNKKEDEEEDPILSCLYKMSFGPAQVSGLQLLV